MSYFENAYACYLSGQIDEKNWQKLLNENEVLAQFIKNKNKQLSEIIIPFQPPGT